MISCSLVAESSVDYGARCHESCPREELKGEERVSNMYPANVGAIDLRAIREKLLLIPMTVPVSSRSTMPVAKDRRKLWQSIFTSVSSHFAKFRRSLFLS
jgi:hypothetical protein